VRARVCACTCVYAHACACEGMRFAELASGLGSFWPFLGDLRLGRWPRGIITLPRRSVGPRRRLFAFLDTEGEKRGLIFVLGAERSENF
jgi:hypothetical protein